MDDKDEMTVFNVLKFVILYLVILGSFIMLMNYLIARSEAGRNDNIQKSVKHFRQPNQ